MRPSLTVLALCLLVIAALAATGCGLKGDLYLPEDAAAATPPDTQADEDDEDSSRTGSPTD